jgi:phosphopantetheinyl transferase
MHEFLRKNARQFEYTFGVIKVSDCERYVAPHSRLDTILSVDEISYVERAPSYKRKVEFIAGRLAAKKAFGYMFDTDESIFPHINISKKENGVPEISDCPDCVVTISHSHDFAIALLARRPIGLDLEKIERRPPALVTYFCHPDEKSVYDQFRENIRLRDELVTTWWTRKEAISKYTQRGGHMIFRDLNTNDDVISIGTPPEQIRLFSTVENGYAMTIAV